jgi:SAM-dependent methyltransferase
MLSRASGPRARYHAPIMATRKMHSSPREYDGSINWEARLKREIPVFRKLFGPPGEYALLDAACGTGRQAVTLARRGYRVVALDKSPEMIAFARARPGADSARLEWHTASFAQLARRCPGPFAGIYCIGNSLCAAGSAAAVQKALHNFAAVLQPSGRLFIQVLNYPLMRRTVPCVKGPVHFFLDGVEHVRVRMFDFARTRARVTNITLRRDRKWSFQAIRGRIFVFTPGQVQQWCRQAGLRIEKLWGSYAGEKFDPDKSTDLIVIARPGKRRR